MGERELLPFGIGGLADGAGQPGGYRGDEAVEGSGREGCGGVCMWGWEGHSDSFRWKMSYCVWGLVRLNSIRVVEMKLNYVVGERVNWTLFEIGK